MGQGGQDGQSYISCIIIDGAPILPPIMNEARRQEMRAYRQLALEREAARATRRQMKTPQKTCLEFESRYLTSTPKAKENDGDDEYVPINLPVSPSTSPPSPASSTGTFIIKKTPGEDKTEGEVDELEQDFEPQTVLRRPSFFPFSATVSQSNSKASAPTSTPRSTSYSARAATSAQSQTHPGWGSDTFLVSNQAWRKRNLNSNNWASGRLVAELGTIPSNRVAGTQQRSSLANRQPWKK